MECRSRPFVAVAVAVAAALMLTGCGGRGADGDAQTATTSPPSTQPALPEGLSTVAQAKVSAVEVYAEPGATGEPKHTLDNPIPSGTPLVFLVRKLQDDWLEVDLPVRPNGSTGWIRAADVTTTTHDYRIVVELDAHRITVYKGTAKVLEESVALGKGNTPTPGGRFYIKELLQPPNPNTVYGPYAYGLSGFSDAFTSFAGGEAVIGIHGNNDSSSLGQDVSAGCIRMSNPGITKLAKILPLGTPVEIDA